MKLRAPFLRFFPGARAGSGKPVRASRERLPHRRWHAGPQFGFGKHVSVCVSEYAHNNRTQSCENQRKMRKNTSTNGRFADLWTLSNRTFRIHPPPPNPAFSLHQHLSRRSSLSSRRIRTIRSVPQPQISTKSRNPSTQRLINVHGSLSTVH
jgi:hypothetical protein